MRLNNAGRFNRSCDTVKVVFNNLYFFAFSYTYVCYYYYEFFQFMDFKFWQFYAHGAKNTYLHNFTTRRSAQKHATQWRRKNSIVFQHE